MKIKYTKELLWTMSLFSRMTGSRLKDCFEMEGVLHFVVEPGDAGKAIGKGGIVIKNIQEKLKKRVRVVEFSSDIATFVQNLIHPLKVDGVSHEGSVVVLKSEDRNTKGLLIGRNAKNLNMLRDVVQRYFPIEVVKVE